ncbi:hypothetical protein CALCODRAFT_410653, partial [Calocera cornea HHB12733]
QQKAYNIVKRHFNNTFCGSCPNQLLMILYGEGGTGKSRVIQSITKLFKSTGQQHFLIKAAYTGIAASLVDGYTLHHITMIP